MTVGDPGAPSMDAILASIKRIIAEDVEIPAQPLRRLGTAMPDVLDLTEEADSQIPFVPSDEEGHSRIAPGASTALGTNGAKDAARARLDALSAMVLTACPPGSDTLEGLVREMLRPMLAEWLDAKLPAMVERLVAVEIERITGRN